MTPKQVLQWIERDQIEYIDLRYMDFPSLWQSITVPAHRLKEDTFERGMGFDGSAVRGWQALNEADMILLPVAETTHRNPFADRPTLCLICDIKDPVTRKKFSRDPRSIARKAANHLAQSNIADQALFGPELEFFIFDQVAYGSDANSASYFVDSQEGSWNRPAAEPTNLGMQLPLHEGTFPAPPFDTLSDLRAEIVHHLETMRIPVDQAHHEVATGGQCEIDLHHRDLVDICDSLVLTKWAIRSLCARHGKVATFMPKPLYKTNGSGLHTHFSLRKQGKPILQGRHYAGLSQIGLYVVGGLLRHAPAILAFSNPTTNSFKRLVPGYEAPIHLIYSSRNRAAAIRVPVYEHNPESRRVEFRCPDSSCNPYLAYAAMVMAAIDGIRNKIDPGEPMDKPLEELDPAAYEQIPTVPHSLEECLEALSNDYAFLLQGEVFTEELIHYWIQYKQEIEVEALRQRPHPFEFDMYFQV